MKILYFSWIREKVGVSSQEINIDENISDISEIIVFLKNFSAKHHNALSDQNSIRVAINKNFSSFDTKIKNKDEIAFFPPVTGG